MAKPMDKKLNFHSHPTYQISRFQRFLKHTDRQTDGQTDGQAQTNMPPKLLRSWGHNKLKYKSIN